MWFAFRFGSSRSPSPHPGRVRFALEELESRCLLSASPAIDPVAAAVVPPTFSAATQARELQIATEKGAPRVVFLGDSITDWFANGAGAGVWDSTAAWLPADDFGVSGYTTQNVLWQVANGDLAGIHPQLVVLMIGINNLLQGYSPLQTAEGVAFDVQAIHAAQPQAQILVLNILPTGYSPNTLARSRVGETNFLISQLVNGHVVHHLDVGWGLLQPDGSISPALLFDGIHPTALGYGLLWQAEQSSLLILLTTPEERAYVSALYQGFLGRTADTAALAYWGGRLALGASPTEVAAAILDSAEYHGREIDQLFEALLGRAPDPVEGAYWFRLMQAGGTVRQVEDGILGSQAFFVRSGGTVAGFLRDFYHAELGRDPLPADVGRATGELAAGASRAAVAAQVLGTREARADLVTAFYKTELGRSPDPAGLSLWAGALGQGQSEEAVQAALVASGEFLRRLEAALAAAGGDPNGAVSRLLQAGFDPGQARELLQGAG